jgi:MFS family permease
MALFWRLNWWCPCGVLIGLHGTTGIRVALYPVLTAMTSKATEISSIAPPVGSRITRVPLLAPLRETNYALFWGSNAVSLAGTQFQAVALAMLALQLTQSTAILGTLLMLQFIPRTLLMLAGGVMADRFRPYTVLWTGNILQGLCVCGVVVPMAAGQLSLWHLYVYAAVSGVLTAFTVPASQALLPRLVARERLRSANALASLNLNLSMTLYPPIAGMVVAQMGSLPGFAVNAGSFLLAGLAIWLIRLPVGEAVTGAAGTAWQRLQEGLVAVRRDRVIWTATVSITAFSFATGGAVQVGVPALAIFTFDSGSTGVGLLLGANGAGAIAGAVGMGMLPGLRRQGLLGAIALLGLGVAVTLVALAPSVFVAALLLALAGTLRAALANIYLTLVQDRAPAEVRGRVMAVFLMAVHGLAPLSLGAGGLLGDMFGPRALIAVCGLVVVSCGSYALAQKPFRETE